MLRFCRNPTRQFIDILDSGVIKPKAGMNINIHVWREGGEQRRKTKGNERKNKAKVNEPKTSGDSYGEGDADPLDYD